MSFLLKSMFEREKRIMITMSTMFFSQLFFFSYVWWLWKDQWAICAHESRDGNKRDAWSRKKTDKCYILFQCIIFTVNFSCIECWNWPFRLVSHFCWSLESPLIWQSSFTTARWEHFDRRTTNGSTSRCNYMLDSILNMSHVSCIRI
jgi:hypothetical protein